MGETRREALRLALGGTGALALGVPAAAATTAATDCPSAPQGPLWRRGAEGRRVADLGNGTYRNPVLAGDWADPTVLKDGDDYYMTHSAFDATPGLLIWHSRDLVNWTPVGPALRKPLGTVFACDLIKHGGRFYIYIPFMKASWSPDLPSFANIYVIHAERIEGPWSDPIDVGVGGAIDPGHAVGEDGERYLFLSGTSRVRLSPDGLKAVGPLVHVYDGWPVPDDWIIEGVSLEGPKVLRRGEWFYLISATGGTSGPATGHMVIAARSRSIHGPWENCPANPIVRSRSADEPWHSRGHATAVEGPGGQWYLVYHGYEKGFHTLGRQTLLEPIEWTAEGWPRALGGDLSRPLPIAGGGRPAPLSLLSDDFAADSLGTRWTLRLDSPPDPSRVRIGGEAMVLAAKGTGPQDATVVTQQVGERAYRIEAEITVEDGAQGGVLLYFNDRMFFGMGIDGQRMVTYGGGKPGYWQEPAPETSRLFLRIENDRHVVTYFYSSDGRTWTRHGVRAEVSGVHADTMAELAQLRPAVFAAGTGKVRVRGWKFAALA